MIYGLQELQSPKILVRALHVPIFFHFIEYIAVTREVYVTETKDLLGNSCLLLHTLKEMDFARINTNG